MLEVGARVFTTLLTCPRRQTPVHTRGGKIDPEFVPTRPCTEAASDITVEVRFFDVGAGVAGAAILMARLASGEPSQEPLRITYRASPNCGSEAQFVAALQLRAPRVRLAKSDEVARIFSVEIAEGPTSTRARLTIREPSGVRTVRDLETKDCREAVDALALIAALAVDPAAIAVAESATAKDRAGSANRSGAANRDVATPRAATSAAEGTTPSSDPVASDTPSALADTSRSPGSPESSALLWRWNVAGQSRAGLAPGLLWGGRIGLELESRRRRWLAPTLRLSGEYSPLMTFALSGGRASFSYGGAILEICPLTARITDALSARPCVTADIGWVFAQGLDVPNPRSATRLRLAGGLQAHFEWSLVAPISVELDIGCTFPLKRDRFRFDPVLIYEMSGIGGIGALGVVMHFP